MWSLIDLAWRRAHSSDARLWASTARIAAVTATRVEIALRPASSVSASSCGSSVSRPMTSLPEPGDLAVAKAADDVIVHHADRLHVRVDDGRADEAEVTLAQIRAERVRLLRARRDVVQTPTAILSRAIVDEAPLVCGEAAELLLHLQERARVSDCGLDLQPIADDPGVPQELSHFPLVEAGDARRLEVGEGLAVRVA